MKRFIYGLWMLAVLLFLHVLCIKIKKKTPPLQFIKRNKWNKYETLSFIQLIKIQKNKNVFLYTNDIQHFIKKYDSTILKTCQNREIMLLGAGFSNTVHNDVKKNTTNYSEDTLPLFHKYIENLKTKKIIHPSIRLNELDKKFMKCKESYNKSYSPLSETDIFANFIYTGRQKKGITSPKYMMPKYVEKPNYHKTGVPISIDYNNNDKKRKNKKYEYINVKTDEEIEIIAENSKFARSLIDDVSYIIREGITTNDIDIYIVNKCINNGFYPSPLFYNQFPKSCCISINEILCHGIPDNNVLFENDIVKVDISVFRNGYHTDMCESFIVKKKEKNQIRKEKKYYDFIYLNDNVKTKYTKFIFKYHFDLTKNKVVRKGKSFTTKKYKYTAPNTKEQEIISNINESDIRSDIGSNIDSDIWEEENDILSNEYVFKRKLQNSEYIPSDSEKKENELKSRYNEEIDYIEHFNRVYDQRIIYHPEDKNSFYDKIQNYIYKKNEQSQQRRLEFFDRKINTEDLKKIMYEKNVELIKTAYECTMEAISVCKHGVPFNKIATVIDNCIKKKNKNYYVVPNLCGHNIGLNFHEEPYIHHTLNNDDRKMCENLIFTIEPIISEAPSNYLMWPDNWTLSNKRYFFSAQFEHTVWVKKDGVEILTRKTKDSPKFEWEC